MNGWNVNASAPQIAENAFKSISLEARETRLVFG
jgi:hypothetical protein